MGICGEESQRNIKRRAGNENISTEKSNNSENIRHKKDDKVYTSEESNKSNNEMSMSSKKEKKIIDEKGDNERNINNKKNEKSKIKRDEEIIQDNVQSEQDLETNILDKSKHSNLEDGEKNNKFDQRNKENQNLSSNFNLLDNCNNPNNPFNFEEEKKFSNDGNTPNTNKQEDTKKLTTNRNSIRESEQNNSNRFSDDFINDNENLKNSNLKDNNNIIKKYNDYDINIPLYLRCTNCENRTPYIYNYKYELSKNDFLVSFLCQCNQNNKSKEASLLELISEYEPKNTCNMHFSNKLLWFCKNCNIQICEECKQSQHNNHMTEKNKIISDDKIAKKILKIGEARSPDFKGYEILKKIFVYYKIIEDPYKISDSNISISRGYPGIEDKTNIKITINEQNQNQRIDIKEPKKEENQYIKDSIKNNYIPINKSNSVINNFDININNGNFIKEIDPKNIKCIKTLTGHQKNIVSLIQLSSGYIASGSYDLSIRIWDVEQGQCIKILYDVGNILCLLEFKPNILLAGTSENNISLWEIDKLMDTSSYNFNGHSLWINSIVKCDEQYFASASNDASIIIWDFDNRKEHKILEGHNNSILCMIKLNDGRLCSGAADNMIKIWDWKKNFCSMDLTGHENWVKCLYQLDESTLLSGSDDKTIKVWKNYNCIATISGHTNSVRTFCKINDNFFASGSFDHTINIWNSQNFKLVNSLNAHESRVICIIKLKNNKLVSCSNDNTIKIWE